MAIDTATLLQLRQPHLQPKQRTIAKIRRLGISRASRESTKPQNWRAQTNTELSSRAVDFYCEVATCPASAKFQQVTQTNDYSSLTMALATSMTRVLFVSPRAWPLPSTEVVRVPSPSEEAHRPLHRYYAANSSESPRAWPLPSTEVVRVPTRPTSNNSERISYFELSPLAKPFIPQSTDRLPTLLVTLVVCLFGQKVKGQTHGLFGQKQKTSIVTSPIQKLI